MSGDSYTQYGAGSIGKAEHTGSGDIVAGGKRVGGPEAGESAIETLLAEVRAMRQHLGEGDRAEVDAAIEELNSNPPKTVSGDCSERSPELRRWSEKPEFP